MLKKSRNQIKEFSLIGKIKKILPAADITKSIGDDCAVIKTGKDYYLYTIDNMVDGVHFDISLGMSYEEIGFKSVVRAISDIVAMGGRPAYGLLSLLIPPHFKEKDINKIISGIKKAGDEYNIFVIGGDISSSQLLTITVAAIGIMKAKPLFRDGARPEDYIYHTGVIGYARAGLELLRKGVKDKKYSVFTKTFLTPKLRLGFAKELAERKLANSMIDISDGFLGDLNHILEESKVGCLLYYENFRTKPFERLKNIFSEDQIYQFILNGGDDYELIFTAHPSKEKDIFKLAEKHKLPLTKVGKITKKGFYLLKDNKKTVVRPESYEHIV